MSLNSLQVMERLFSGTTNEVMPYMAVFCCLQVIDLSFYDVLLDFVLLDAFDDLATPPYSVATAVQNRWLSARIKETVSDSLLPLILYVICVSVFDKLHVHVFTSNLIVLSGINAIK